MEVARDTLLDGHAEIPRTEVNSLLYHFPEGSKEVVQGTTTSDQWLLSPSQPRLNSVSVPSFFLGPRGLFEVEIGDTQNTNFSPLDKDISNRRDSSSSSQSWDDNPDIAAYLQTHIPRSVD
jgi:hypothetical protein